MLLASDRTLLERFRAGDPDAMGRVFDHYSDDVARHLASGFSFDGEAGKVFFAGVQQPADLHDLVAETFRRAFEVRARQGYGGVSSYAGYLKTIARNLVLDRLRSKSERWVALDEAAGHDGVAETAEGLSPEERYQRAELQKLVARFRGELDDTQQRFLDLRYEEGLSQAELAEQLGCTRRWVRTTETELRARLLKHLKGTGYLKVEGSR